MKFAGIILLSILTGTSCSYSQSKKTGNMDENKTSKHTVYSHTDTSKVSVSEEEWRKVLVAGSIQGGTGKRHGTALDKQI
jgi:peptide-methionine (R)-S-oxide reductase